MIIKTSKVILLILSITLLLCVLRTPVSGFSTNPTTTNISRVIDQVQAFRNESIMFTVSFENSGAITLRGFYYVDHIPEGLTINTISVMIDGNDISNNVQEFGSTGDVYNGTIPYRWILETPDSFDENNPIDSNSRLEIVYSVSSDQLGTFNFDEFHWVGYYQDANEGERAAFGYNEETDKLTVNFLNSPPEAINDSTSTLEDSPITINILTNDDDHDGTIDPNTVSISNNPANGDIIINDDGTVIYTPESNFHGTDNFTYTINDNDGAVSNEAIVTITITPDNDTPEADSQFISTDEDIPADITLTGNDTDEDPLTFILVDQPAHGTLSGTAPILTYSPNPDYNGPDSFTFIVNDGTADSDIATVSITVISINDPPMAINDTAITLKNTPITVNMIENDSDPDGTIEPGSIIIVIAPGNGSFNINGDGTVTYTPTLDFIGTDVFNYTVEDNEGAISNEAMVTVTVNESVDRLDLDQKIKEHKDGDTSEENVKRIIRQYMEQIL